MGELVYLEFKVDYVSSNCKILLVCICGFILKDDSCLTTLLPICPY